MISHISKVIAFAVLISFPSTTPSDDDIFDIPDSFSDAPDNVPETFSDSVGSGRKMRVEGKKKRKKITVDVKTPESLRKETLRSDDVRVIVNSNIKSIQYCYERSLTRRPELHGKVIVGFDVNKAGRVEKPQIIETSLGDQETEDCVIQQLTRWEFPIPTTPPVSVTYPFVFVPKS